MSGTLIAALVLVACSSGGLTSPSEDVAGRDDSQAATEGWVIDPVPSGYERCAISVRSGLELSADAGASLRVYGEPDRADPYAGPLYGVAVFEAGQEGVPVDLDALELGDTSAAFAGDIPARLGGIDGLQLASLPATAGRALTWVLPDGRVAQLAVRGDDAADLEAIAAGIAVGDSGATIDPTRLGDGMEDFGDLYQLEGRARFRFSVDHQGFDAAGEITDQLTLLGSEGDATSMEAFRFRVPASERVDVAGAPGVAAELGFDDEGPWVLSWIPADGVVLQIFSFRLRPEELATLATATQRIEGDAWAGLVEVNDPGTCTP